MNQFTGNFEDRLGALERQVAHARDLSEINEVLVRYSRALDWLDDALLDSVILDDAEIDYGFFKGSGKDFKPVLMAIERGVGRRWHFTSQVEIALYGDRAEVESYNLTLGAASISPSPPDEVTQFYGKYIDVMLRRDGRWGIIQRRHLLLSAFAVRELPLEGNFAQFNRIGEALTTHPDYRAFAIGPNQTGAI